MKKLFMLALIAIATSCGDTEVRNNSIGTNAEIVVSTTNFNVYKTKIDTSEYLIVSTAYGVAITKK